MSKVKSESDDVQLNGAKNINVIDSILCINNNDILMNESNYVVSYISRVREKVITVNGMINRN